MLNLGQCQRNLSSIWYFCEYHHYFLLVLGLEESLLVFPMKLFYHLNYKGKRATYRTAPHLPFQGNKSIGRKKFIDIIKRKKDEENNI